MFSIKNEEETVQLECCLQWRSQGGTCVYVPPFVAGNFFKLYSDSVVLGIYMLPVSTLFYFDYSVVIACIGRARHILAIF